MTENKGNTNPTSIFGNMQNDPSKQTSSNMFPNNSFFGQKNDENKGSGFLNNSTNKPAENENKSALGGQGLFSNINKDTTSNAFATGNSMNLFGNSQDKSTEQKNPNIPENNTNQTNNSSKMNFLGNVDAKKDNNPPSFFAQNQTNAFSSNFGKTQSDPANTSFGGPKNETNLGDNKITQNLDKNENNSQNLFSSSKDKANSLFGNTGFGQPSSNLGQAGGSSLFGGNKEENKPAQGSFFTNVADNKQNEVKKEETKSMFGSQQGMNNTVGNQSNPLSGTNKSTIQPNSLFTAQSSSNVFSGQPAQTTENKSNPSNTENKQASAFNFGQTDNKQQSSILGGNSNVNPLFGSTGPSNTENKNLFGSQQPASNDNKTQSQPTSSLFSGGSSSMFGKNTSTDKPSMNFGTNSTDVKKEEKKETSSLFSSNNQPSITENKPAVNFMQPSSIPETKSSTNLFQPSTTENKSNAGLLQPSANEAKPSSSMFNTFGGQQENKFQLNVAPEKKDQTDKKDPVENKTQIQFSTNFGGGDKKAENKDQSSTFTFGGNQTKNEISFGSTENKNIVLGNLNSTKTEENKLTEIKKDGKIVDTVSFSQNQLPPLKDLDKAGVDNLMKRSIEEVINKWKKEMDKQTSKFTDNGERLKHFEQIFNKNFENLMEVSENINQIEAQSKNTLNDLKELNNQEDIIIDQLSLMEKHLDTYLNVFEKKTYPDNNNPRDYIYLAADEISNMVDNIETGINEVKDRLYNIGSENTKEIQFNLNEKEDLNFDANEFNSLLNNYYNALNGITFMEHNMKLKINEIENDLKIKKDKDQSYKNTFNY